MIYITGDTHGRFERLSDEKMKNDGLKLTEKDYLIICGDFGLCWERNSTFEYNCEQLAQKNYTILWVQGNHENYDMIAEYPLEEWHGGKVRHIVRDKVILLERGQVFNIEGKTYFTFGGASSQDIQGGILERSDIRFNEKRQLAYWRGLPFRINHESWWEKELPDEIEMEEGRKNLAKHDYKIDYVITHCCSTHTQNKIEDGSVYKMKADKLTDYFDEIEEKLQYIHWFLGHYHMDKKIDEKHSVLYQTIISLEDYVQ